LGGSPHQRDERSEKAARKKEIGVNHVGDTSRDNGSSTKPQSLAGYVEDA
jgi:hypothetical protein